MSKDWIYHTNIYEVNTRQYTEQGTFNAFAEHIPRLKDMGVQILWFMPITPISKEDRLGTLGSYYACSDYISVNPEYGNIEDFKATVQKAHENGLRVIIDWVANHTGVDHVWAKQHPEWYRKDAVGRFIEVNGWKDVIDLDYDNKMMRAAMISAMQFWITECDIDGFRCDMAHLVPLNFWQQAQVACEQLKPLFWLAETDNKEYHKVFDVSYAWEWMHASEKLYQQQVSLGYVEAVLEKYEGYPKNAFKLYFTANHDENSWNGTEYEKYGVAAKLFAAFTALWKGVPLLYSGQELPNHKRLHFFEKDLIPWNEHEPLLHDFYKDLFALRNNEAFSRDAQFIILKTNSDDKLLCFLRTCNTSKVLTLMNFSSAIKLRFTINHPLLNGVYKNVFSGMQYRFQQIQSFELQSWEYLVFSCE